MDSTIAKHSNRKTRVAVSPAHEAKAEVSTHAPVIVSIEDFKRSDLALNLEAAIEDRRLTAKQAIALLRDANEKANETPSLPKRKKQTKATTLRACREDAPIVNEWDPKVAYGKKRAGRCRDQIESNNPRVFRHYARPPRYETEEVPSQPSSDVARP